MRPVKFKKWIPLSFDKETKKRVEGTGQLANDFTNGLFHEWALDYEDHVGNYTIALIELEDGSIEKVQPKNLKFTGKINIELFDEYGEKAILDDCLSDVIGECDVCVLCGKCHYEVHCMMEVR